MDEFDYYSEAYEDDYRTFEDNCAWEDAMADALDMMADDYEGYDM